MNNNLHLNINSLLRIFDLIFETYADSVDIVEFTDPKLFQVLIHIFKTKYLDAFIIKFSSYVNIDGNDVYIKKNDKKDTEDDIKIKTNYIIKKFIIEEVIRNFLISYFNNKKYKFSNLYSNIDYLLKEFINYINEQINELLN